MTSADRFTSPDRMKQGVVPRARRLRSQSTWTEGELWKQLRHCPIRIRRQAPVGPYVVDFACLRARLVIELDGAVHDLPEVALRDAERDAFLSSQGFRVLRIDARRIPSETTAVVEEILAAIRAKVPLPLEGEGVRGWGGGSESQNLTQEARNQDRRPTAHTRPQPASTPTHPSPLEGEGS